MVKKKPIFLKVRSARWYILATVALSMFTDMMVYSIIVPIMPFTIEALHKGIPPDHLDGAAYDSTELSDDGAVSKDTGVLLALFAAGLLLGSPILGYLGDRMKHRKWPMIAGILGLLVSTFLFLFAEAYWELLLARFLQGFSDSCVWTLGMCLIADSFPLNELGTQMGRVLFFHSCGLVLGAPIGALFHNTGYKAPFILCICLAGLDFVLRIFLVERRNQPPEWFNDNPEVSTVEPSTIVNPAPEATVEKQKKERVTVFKLLRQHRLIASLIIAFANGCVFNVFEPTLPVRLSSEWGYNSSQIGVIFLAQAIPTFVASPVAGYITDKYGAKVIAFSTVLICAVATMLVGVPNRNTAGGIAPLIVLLVIQGFSAFACITPVLPEIAIVVKSLNPDDGDDGQGMSYALFNIAFGLGGLVGPLFGGFLYGKIGFFYMSLIFGLFLLLCAPYILKYTGEPGKFICRPADKQQTPSPEMIGIEEEIASNYAVSSKTPSRIQEMSQ